MMKKIIFSVLLILVGVLIYNYLYQDHRDIKKEKAEFIVTPKSIKDEFSVDFINAEKKYLNKTIKVSGLVNELGTKDLTLNMIMFCQFGDIIDESIKINSKLKIKGRCIGYDDLLEQIKLDQCSIINN